MFRTIRFRLTLWYVSFLSALLIAFSGYLYSFLAHDLHDTFDNSLRRVVHSGASYFSEFVERNKMHVGALETVREMEFGSLRAGVLEEGKVIACSSDGRAAAAIVHARRSFRNSGVGRVSLTTDERTNARLAKLSVRINGIRYTVVVFEPLTELQRELARMQRAIFIGLFAALVLAAAGGLLLTRKTLEPIVSISEQAARISEKNLNDRLHTVNPRDELGRLAAVINSLLGRLESSFSIMREFMADAAHDLRTPLTVVTTEADVAVSQERAGSEYRKSLNLIREQSGRMGRIVGDMLELVRADAGTARPTSKTST